MSSSHFVLFIELQPEYFDSGRIEFAMTFVKLRTLRTDSSSRMSPDLTLRTFLLIVGSLGSSRTQMNFGKVAAQHYCSRQSDHHHLQ